MVPCYKCGFWDSDYEACTCPSSDMWYACPIESRKPENIKALEEYIEWHESKERNCKDCKHSDNGECAFTEECHECMWLNKYEEDTE